MINNVNIYGVEESVLASGYPMLSDVKDAIISNKRAKVLGNAKPGSGHDCFLKGIIVQFDLKMSQAMYMQMSRYHFIDFVSSQSKMHRLVTMDISESVNEYVSQTEIENTRKRIARYQANPSEELYLKVIYNAPMGLEMTSRMTTNYLQLKTIYNQRKSHKLPEWREFCEWVRTLPNFKEWCLNEN